MGRGGAPYELFDKVWRCINDHVRCTSSDKVYKTVRELRHLISAKRVIPHVSSISISVLYTALILELDTKYPKDKA